jgi:hypothetical protein
LRIEGFAEELERGDAGNFDRVLEAEEQPGGGAFVGGEGKEIYPPPARGRG